MPYSGGVLCVQSMLRGATWNYGRVLRAHAIPTARTAFITRLESSSPASLQLRMRSRTTTTTTTATPLQTGTRIRATTKRKAGAVDAIKDEVIKEEVRASESVDSVNVFTARRSPRTKIKSEVVVQVKTEDVTTELDVQDGDEQDEDDGQNKPNKKRRVRVVKRGADGKPERWDDVLRGIQEMRASQIADVDVAGVEVMFDEDKFAPHVARFHVLISAMLSSQTKDPVNAAAMKRLIARGLTVKDMLAIDEKELAQLIHPVGFYNNKARYIKQVAQILTDKAIETGSDVVDIPNTFDDLVALPGVGPKMAYLVMSCAWDNTVGICVDTHVHRISNRLGWVSTWNKKNPKSQDPEKTRKELEDWLPREHWNPINVTLVGFGQTVCLPRGPKCSECKINHLCPSAFSSAI